MPCIFKSGDETRKTVKIVGTNFARQVIPDQITVGKAFRIDTTDNFIADVFEACLLSSARTGICAAIATRLLAPRRAKVGLIGAGRVGYYSALYIAALGGVSEICIDDVNRNRAQMLVRALAGELRSVRITARDPLAQAGLDVLVLATDSRVPVYAPGPQPGSLVISVGADSNAQSELHDSCAAAGSLYVDFIDSAQYGDLQRWLAQGLIKSDSLTDLCSVIREQSVEPGLKFFISTGIALFDNLAIGYLLQATP